MRQLNRRIFIVGGLAAGGATAAGITAAAASGPSGIRAATLPDPFQVGVASGDPRPDGMVLWTRLAPAPLDVDGGMGTQTVAVTWQVATDEAFGNVVATGTENATPDEGHSIHAEPRGLNPSTVYYYRFSAAGHISPVGRTRTAPAPGASVSKLKFAFASCAHFEQGFYHAYRHLADDEPDVVLFLGDFIYQAATSPSKQVRMYIDFDSANHLGEYRLRYNQHRTDPALRAAQAVAPWIAVFDDHELTNNWWGHDSAEPDSRKAAAFQAFWENMPMPRSMKPTSPAIALYRRLDWGTLARFHMMDTRQYRWEQAPNGNCTVIKDPGRSLTGDAQEQWLLDGLTARTSGWDLLGQQVFFASRDTDGKSSTCDVSEDAWDGYQPNRKTITQGWVDRKVRNPVVLTGDVHRAWANDLRVNYFDYGSPIVGAELVTSSITSLGSRSNPDLTHLPHVNYVSPERGYVRATLTPAALTAEFVAVKNVTQVDPAKATASVVRKFVIEDGKPGLQAP